jgi:hypothetical protein
MEDPKVLSGAKSVLRGRERGRAFWLKGLPEQQQIAFGPGRSSTGPTMFKYFYWIYNKELFMVVRVIN